MAPAVMIEPGATYNVADIRGPGRITHVWLTTRPDCWRSSLLRMHWDGDPKPAVELPLGDLFVQGTGVFAQVNALPISANSTAGLNSYWPMPFRRGARVTVENLGSTAMPLFYQITYEAGGDQDRLAYFHAQWRRSNPVPTDTPHVLLEGIEGHGHYVGTSIIWQSNTNGWWGEGEVKFYMDDDDEFPTICGTGTEDYFGGAWNFADRTNSEYVEYSTPYLGLPQAVRPDGIYAAQTRFAMYRYHVADPIHFAERLSRVEIQALGFEVTSAGTKFKSLRDDVASTSIFYLDRTSSMRPPTPDLSKMWTYPGTSAEPGTPPMHLDFLLNG